MEKIFQIAIDKANEESGGALELHGIAVAIEPGNAFETSKKLCKMLRVSTVALQINILYVKLLLYSAKFSLMNSKI